MNAFPLRLAVAALVLSTPACRRNEQAASAYNAVSNTGFATRTLAETAKEMSVAADAPPGVITFSGDHRSIARVIFAGKMRPIPAAHKQAIQLAQKNTGTVPLADEVKNELLFLEGTTEYWMPVGAKTEPDFKNLKPGQPIDLYATFVAALKDASGRLDYIFVAQEFLEREPA